MDNNRNKENLVPKDSPEESDEMEETPTNEEIMFSSNNPELEKLYRFCISPIENSETSSGGDTTPDAALLNKSPFEFKVVPKLLSKRKSSNSPVKTDSSDAHAFKTPEKLPRPVNFKNLSPRSVTYEFSGRYPSSGILRPRKVSRSYNSLFERNPLDPCCSKSLKQGRAKSDEPIEIAERDTCGSPPRKKKHARSVSFSDRVDIIRGIISHRTFSADADKLAASMEPMSISPETDVANVVIDPTETATTDAISPNKDNPTHRSDDNTG